MYVGAFWWIYDASVFVQSFGLLSELIGTFSHLLGIMIVINRKLITHFDTN